MVIKRSLKRIMFRFKTADQLFMIIIPIVIGLLAGLGAALLRFLIHRFQDLFWGNQDYSGSILQTLAIPTGAAFIVGMIIYFFSKEAKGHGVPEVLTAIATEGSKIRPRVVVSKVLASSITIASGGSVGREGPIIQIGAAIGSVLGQFFKISKKRIETLVGCGAAAGIAAAFNAPIAGAMFAVEILLGNFSISRFSPIVISSVSATVISRMFYGNHPALVIPQYELINPIELLPYMLLGFLAGLVGIIFVKVLYFFEDKFDSVKIPDFYKTATGGLLLGVIGLKFPAIFGIGYSAMGKTLNGEMAVSLLFALIFLKILASSLTLGSGSSGGIFAPSLFMGAMTGGFFGNLIHKLLPGLTANPGAYATVGMSAVVAATTHAPITAILIIFEMTNDYKIILPLMIATIISLFTAKILKGSIYTLKLKDRGIPFEHGKEINILKSMQVSEVMRDSIEIIPPNLPLPKVIEKFVKSEHENLFILNSNGEIIEKISQPELAKIAPEYSNVKDFVISSDISTPIRKIFLDKDHLDYVMKEFSKENINEIPVVSSSNPSRILGTIWRIDTISAYNKEILRRDLAGELSHLLSTASGSDEMIEIAQGFFISEAETPQFFIGKSVGDLDVRNKYNIDIILIKDSSKPEVKVILPDKNYCFKDYQHILIIGNKRNINKFHCL
jgi:CIC family chloride channel protein